MGGHHIGGGEDFRHRIRGGDGRAGDFEGGQVDQVIADKDGFFCPESSLMHHRFQALTLVADAGVALGDPQFPGSQIGALAGSSGDPDDGDAEVEETANAGSVRNEEILRFAAIGVDRHPVVGEDPIDIEGEQARPQGGQVIGDCLLHDNSLACDP